MLIGDFQDTKFVIDKGVTDYNMGHRRFTYIYTLQAWETVTQ